MNRLILVFLLILLPVAGRSQANKNGVPVIENYTPEMMSAAEQNWAVVQDHRGVIYLGNNDDGVIEYDGKSWHKIRLPNNSSVKSLACDSRGTIYVGAIGEFGYLEPDDQGLMVYKSLVNLLDSANRGFAQHVWKTFCVGDSVFFSATEKLFIYDNKKVKQLNLPVASNFCFNINGRIFVGNFRQGLMELKADTVEKVRGGDFFIYKNIFALLPWKDNQVLVGTGSDGLFSFDLETGQVGRNIVSQEVNEVFRSGTLYSGTRLANGWYAFTTLYGGGYILDSNMQAVSHLTAENGLQNQIIISTYSGEDPSLALPLWLAMNEGLTRVDYHIPIRKFDETTGLKGFVMDVIRFQGDLYVATFNGVYRQSENGEMVPILYEESFLDQAWSFAALKDPATGKQMLLVGTLNGIYDITSGTRAEWFDQRVKGRIDQSARIASYRLYVNPAFPNHILVGDNGGLIIIEYRDGNWWVSKVEGIDNEVRSIAYDPDGSIWASTYINGVYHYSYSDTDTSLVHYTLEDGLPLLKENEIFPYLDSWRVATRMGIYTFNRQENRFEPDQGFPREFHDGRYGVFRFKPDEDGNYWVFLYKVTAEERIHRVMKLIREPGENSWQIDSISYGRFDKWVDALYPDQDSLVWFGRADGLYSYDEKLARIFPMDIQYGFQPYYTLIRKIRVNQDSVVFNGAFYNLSGEQDQRIVSMEQNPEFKFVFPFSMRNLDIEWVAPFFEDLDKTEYSYRLLGSQQNTWTAWSSTTDFPFYNLSPGHYTFEVKARNIYNQESIPGRFEFTVQPPWYQTVVAFLAYFVIAVLIVTLIVRLNARRLVREKIRLEGIVAERTAEVVRQKEEITDSIHYASRIQQALLPSEKVLAENFPSHFIYFRPRDIVSGDFYWMAQKADKVVVVAADCTGHGVPGAFMSMLGISFLNEIINIFNILRPDLILNRLREFVMTSLKQTGKDNETKDGMDIAVLVFDKKAGTVQYAGAYNPLYLVRKARPDEGKGRKESRYSDSEEGELRIGGYVLTQVKADKMPIGISAKPQDHFNLHTLKVEEGMTLYIFSDGYVDQFGGTDGRKFLSRNFKRLLLDIQDQDLAEQYHSIDQNFLDWKGSLDQVDDIIVIGIRV